MRSPDTIAAPPGAGQELAGLDRLELGQRLGPRPLRRLLSATWPKVAAISIALGLWQLVVLAGFKPTYVLPGPDMVLPEFVALVTSGELLSATALTMQRALSGYAVALVIGTLLGIVVARSSIARRAVGSLITGLQTMPSIAWFPLAILLFQLSEAAILFVVVLGAAPAIANGLIAGIDTIPPVLLRAGRVLGASGFAAYRHIVLPAALPTFLSGMKQGWAFAWRSLMAGELLVIVAGRPSLGARLQFARELSDAVELLALMLAILLIGIAVDGAFGILERRVRERRGLIAA